MKKTLMIALPLILVAIIAGIFFFTKKGEAPVTEEKKEAVQKVVEEAKDSVVGSLKDAIGLGKKMECVYKEGDMESKTYIDGTKYKSVTSTSEGEMISVFDGSDFYGWITKTKEEFATADDPLQFINLSSDSRHAGIYLTLENVPENLKGNAGRHLVDQHLAVPLP